MLSAALSYTSIFLVRSKSNERKRTKAVFLLLVLETTAEIHFFSSFWPSGHAQIYNCNIDLFWGLYTTAEVISQIKMPLLSPRTLVFEINCNIWFFSSQNSVCGIVSQINTYSEVIATKGLAIDKKWNTLLVKAMCANRGLWGINFCKLHFCFCTVLLVVISDGYTKQIQ